jgi:hypothetical protein
LSLCADDVEFLSPCADEISVITQFHYLEPLIKGVIAKMAYLVEFWLILERELVEHAPHEYLLYGYKNGTYNTIYCTLTNTFGLTEFGSVMKNL